MLFPPIGRFFKKQEFPARPANLESNFFASADEGKKIHKVNSREEIKEIVDKAETGVIYRFDYKGVYIKLGFKPGINTLMYQIKYRDKEERCERACIFDKALNRAEELLKEEG